MALLDLDLLLAERTNWLFETFRQDDGTEYSYQTVSDTAARCGYSASPTTIWNLRNGKSKNPRIQTILAVAKFFNIQVQYFFEETLTEQQLEEIKNTSLPEPNLYRIAARTDAITVLSKESQEAINEVIRLIARGEVTK